MKLFEKQDDQGSKRKSKTAKLLRRMKNKRERKTFNKDLDEHTPTHRKNKGWST